MILVLRKGASQREMKELKKKLDLMPSRKRMQAKKYVGTIKLKGDPLAIQKQLRDEWE